MKEKKVEYYAGKLQNNQGWTIPDPIHEFRTYTELEQHFVSTKPIAWGGNYYIFYMEEDFLTIRIDEIDSVVELKRFFNMKSKSAKNKKFIDRFPTWTAPEGFP